VLVRSWNLFHGNAKPPQRRAFLDEMLQLALADEPGVLCVQEVPAWALGRFSVGDVAARPMAGPLPITRAAGRRLTALHNGILRSAFSGQGNAIALAPSLRVLQHRVLTLNTRRFRRAQSHTLGLKPRERLAWAKERRIVQAVRVTDDGGRTFLIANTHCTSSPDRRLPDAELLRAAWFAVSEAKPDDTVVLAGDFNVSLDTSQTLRELGGPEWGFSQPGPGIDHVLVRGAVSSPLRVWPEAQRLRHGTLLSDHAPVEVTVE
jgi:endonuclease/exonuclease/phosphatase family metal-dependent hydrolase